jgi:hypothetical protein
MERTERFYKIQNLLRNRRLVRTQDFIEALQVFHHYYGDEFRVECPARSGEYRSLREVADEVSRRLIRIFTRDGEGRRAVFGGRDLQQRDPHWRDYVLFHVRCVAASPPAGDGVDAGNPG